MALINSYYNLSFSPKLLATSVGQFDNKVVYKNYFGGVVSLTWKQFELINGYPNRLSKVRNMCKIFSPVLSKKPVTREN